MTLKLICPVVLITQSQKFYSLIDRYIQDINQKTASNYQLIWNSGLESQLRATKKSGCHEQIFVYLVDLYYLISSWNAELKEYFLSEVFEHNLQQAILHFKQSVFNSELDLLILVTDDCETGIKTLNAGATDYISQQELTCWTLERTLRLNLTNVNLQQKYRQKIAKIKQQKQSEIGLKYQELARSNAELEQFAYLASHDLQAPLNTITNYAQLLALRYKKKLDNNANKYLDYIVDSARRMKTLIEDLLEYSRLDKQKSTWRETNLYLVVQQAIANLQSEIEANQVTIICDRNFPILVVDASQLIVLWQNLIENSIKYRQQEPLVITIKTESQQDYWQFAVSDNGIGLEPQYKQRIFQIFQRLHTQDEYPGNGIGLAICQKIVERHRGKIGVKSQLGQGSTFYFTIPKSANS